MKPTHSPRGGRMIFGLLAGLCSFGSALASDIPTGTLNVDRSLVRVGSRSNLDWQIQYPTAPVGVNLIPKTKVKMRVRTLGVAFQSGSTLLPFEGGWTKNNSGWTTFFRGNALSVVPTKVLVETTINQGDQIKFRGRGASTAAGTSWFSYHETTNKSDQNVVVLKNGDYPPKYAPAYNQGNIKGFLSPFLDSTGKIKIGEQDLIILWEGSSAAPGTSYFDMQDLVVLVSFEAA